MFRSLVLFCLTAVMVGSVAAGTIPKPAPGEESVPPFIIAGMQAYKSKGPDEAVKAWIKNSPLEGSREVLSQSNSLRQVQDFYGDFLGFDLVATRELSPRTKMIYITLNYEKGPLFCKFVVYRTEQGWILTNLLFNTKEELVFPSDLQNVSHS